MMQIITGKRRMKNIIGYAESETRRLFDRGFHAVDSLVFSKMAYWHFEGIVPGPKENASVAVKSLTGIDAEHTLLRASRDINKDKRFWAAVVANPRFNHARMMHYVQRTDADEEKQFSAVTFLLDDDTAYIAFRGTDGTLVGWKEDFNMTYVCPVPAQEEGARYLNQVARHTGRLLRIGGHSKGGNIAMYAAAKCDENRKERILGVYNHDGPGFRKDFLHNDAFAQIEDRIFRTLPQSSLVGMLLYQEGEYTVVESNRFGIMQHDPFSWKVEEGDFCYVERLTSSASYLNQTMDRWLSAYSDEKRKLFINTLYEVIAATKVTTYHELTEEWHKKALVVLNSYRDIDEETKRFIRDTLGKLIALSLKNIPQEAKKTLQDTKAYKRIAGLHNHREEKQKTRTEDV